MLEKYDLLITLGWVSSTPFGIPFRLPVQLQNRGSSQIIIAKSGNHELFNPRLFNDDFLNHGLKKFMVGKSGAEKSWVEMSSLQKVKGQFNPRPLNHELFNLTVQKFMVEKSRVEKFMVEKSGVEKSGVEISFNCGP